MEREGFASAGIAREKSNAVRAIFGLGRASIGVLHCPPLPGTPRHAGEDFSVTLETALADVMAYAEGGVDGLIVAKNGDIPFLKPDRIGPEPVPRWP